MPSSCACGSTRSCPATVPARAARGADVPPQSSRIDQVLTLAVLAMLIVGVYFVLRPFMTALVWAAILCTTTWPLYQRLRASFGGRDALAALAMVLLLALLMLAPFVVVGL